MSKATYRTDIHFKPLQNNGNARCLNGSAHISKTTDISRVTCIECLNEETHKRFWDQAKYLKGAVSTLNR